MHKGKMSVRQESFLKAPWLLKLVRKFKLHFPLKVKQIH